MLLDATTRKLQLVLTAAMTTANMPVSVYYVDTTATALPVSGNTPTNSNGTTPVDILAAPAASTQRKVNALTVNNADTAAKTVQIYLDDNGTDYLLCAATLQVGDVLGYTDTRGWYVNDSAGNQKMASANAQPFDSTLTSIALLGTAADKLIYTTGIDTWAETGLSAAARTVLDDASVSAMVDTLGGASATGTGGLARATSPTFVTPILGTPTSGDLRNCSLAVAPAIGGTTPAAGAFTTLSASGDVTLTNADETINKTISSNTAYANLAINTIPSSGTYGANTVGALIGCYTSTYSDVSAYQNKFVIQTSNVGSVGIALAAWGASGEITLYAGNRTTPVATISSTGLAVTGTVTIGSTGGMKWYTSHAAANVYLDNTSSAGTGNGLFCGTINAGLYIGGNAVAVAASTGLAVTGAISSTSSILSSGAINGIGYSAGAGGTVAQGAGSGKATGVTLAKVCGTITLDGASLAGDTTVTFLLTMTGFTLNATDQLILSHQSVGTFGAYNLNARYASSTTMNIDIHNTTPGALAEAIVIQYSLIRSVAA